MRRTHRQMLIICCVILAVAPLLKVLPDDRVAVRGFEGVVLPPSCPSRIIFDVSCPGCGLTRSFVHIAHGNWESSLRVNRIGWLIMLMAVLQIPYRLHALHGSGRFVLEPTAANWFGVVLVVILIGNWVIGLFVA
jgi:hypothetical protein